MIELNKIYNENCFDTMKKMDKQIDIVLTSPPYNTSRIGRKDKYSTRYTGFNDNKTEEEYIKWTTDLFKGYENILNENGCVLYNISYSSENTYLLWLVIAEIMKETNFTVADMITWKKKSALPNNVSGNKLTRIVEYVFVICRKSEIKTFITNKKVVKINERTNQKYYENIYNFIKAKNNDGACELNRATFSSELCVKLLDIYAKPNSTVYDSFMGTGTTAIGCVIRKDLNYIGSELSKDQCEFAKNRIEEYIHNKII